MKSLFFFISTLLLISAGQSQVIIPNKSFKLEGRIKGQDTGYIHLNYFNAAHQYIADSCTIKMGAFMFTGSIEEPTMVSFYGNRKSRSIEDPNWTEFFIEPASMQIKVTANDFKKATLTGSNTQLEYAGYIRQFDSLENAWHPVFEKLKQARFTNDTATATKILEQELPVYNNSSQLLILNYILKHPASLVSAYLLNYQTQRLTLDSLKYFFGILQPGVRNTSYCKAISIFIDKADKLEIGKPAPDFTQTDLNNQSFSLHSLKGKYVLLDFWASYCGPCRDQFAQLKEIYKVAHVKGFEVVGISMDKPEQQQDWLQAIKEDNLSWIQLCDFKGWTGKLVNNYNLYGKGIPSNFLINPEGLIIGKNISMETLQQELAVLK